MSKEYSVIVDSRIAKQMQKMPSKTQEKIKLAIKNLANNPKPPNCKKLQGFDYTWRVRVGDYRIIYEIYDNKVQIIVINVKHRRDVYKE